jgi:membrane dipeptidase
MKKILFFLFSITQFVVAAQNYQQVHAKALVVDTHNDVLSQAVMKGLLFDTDLSGKTHSDLMRMKKGGVDVQIFSIFCDERYGTGTAFAYANAEIDSLFAIAKRNPSKMMMVKTPAQLATAIKQKKLAAMMGVEGGHMIEDRLDYLDSFAKRGVRYMTLTWNNSTSWASSAKDETVIEKKLAAGQSIDSLQIKTRGLNELGKQIVKRMNELGILVDLSHVGRQTFWDAINTTTKPVIVSHSCVRKLCEHSRNLDDDQIKAIGKNGGVIHLNFYSGFVDSTFGKKEKDFFASHKLETDSMLALKAPMYEIGEVLWKKYPAEVEDMRPTIGQLVDHMDYIVKLIGVDHVGIGSDFDGINSSPKGLDDVTQLPSLTKELLRRGYTEKEVRKILGENFMRIFKACVR